jgi:hypothetical protein
MQQTDTVVLLFYSYLPGQFVMENKKVKEVFLYFNTTASTAAIENAIWIRLYVNNN